jgi:hypothetical protein
MRFALVPLVILSLTTIASAAPPTDPTLYETLAAQGEYDIQADAFKERPVAQTELGKLSWIEGDWRQVATLYKHANFPMSKKEAGVWTFKLDPTTNSVLYGPKVEEGAAAAPLTPFMTYDVYKQTWFSVEREPDSWGIAQSTGSWTGEKITMEGTFNIRGVAVELRQTFKHSKVEECVVINEQKMPNGKWIAIDEHRFFRVK